MLEQATVTGDLVISGTAYHDGGVERVEIIVQNRTTGQYWLPGGLEESDDPFPVEVAPSDEDPSQALFEVLVPEAELEAGEHVIQVWARGLDAELPAEPTTRIITVP
jgi:hypothetical protein